MDVILSAAKNLFMILTGALIFAGCAAGPQKPVKICPGKNTVEESIAAMNAHSQNIKPLRAAGQCLLKYRVEDKDHKENFPVKIWSNPPGEVYLQGDVAFDATGMVFGSNADEFWLWLKPKEISSYWWGKWSKAGQWEGFILRPEILLEAFGSVNVSNGDWSLTHGRYDILWLHSEQGVLIKRVFVETCDYHVTKIEYFDSEGKITAGAEFSNYKKVSEGFFVPMLIKIYSPAANGGENSAEISLSSTNLIQLNEQQRNRLFVRPKSQGFEHTYLIVNGRAVEQVKE
jgi:hypothetical protein